MKNNLLLFIPIFCFIFFDSYAQIGFQENIIVGNSYTTKYPKTPRTVDIDGDGDLDLVVTGTGVNWYENIDGVGGFGEKNIISDNNLGRSVFAADFDSDGDIDVLNVRQENFTLFENTNGNGVFEESQNIEVDNGALDISIVPADVDNDGDLDIISYSRSNFPYVSTLTWYENTNGNFGAEMVIFNDNEELNELSFLHADDLDGDSLVDIIVGQFASDKIIWLKNLGGNGAFGTPTVITSLADGVRSIFTSDIDDDGDIDIISASSNDNEIAWYENQDGLGDFSDEIIITSSAAEATSVHVADVNNDNFKDIIVGSIVDDVAFPDIENKVVWYSNIGGTGNFGSEQIISNQAYGVTFVSTSDIDGDGNLDVISSSSQDDKVAWYDNIDGDGDFGRQTVIARRIRYPKSVFPGDFDGDGDIDLLANSQSDSKLTWFENVNGIGLYGKQYIITEHPGAGSPLPYAYPTDIDGDGDLDIAVSKQSILTWYENVDGKGNFTTEHIIDDTGGGATIIRSNDMDGDGDMDLVYARSSNIFWLENLDSNGTFGPEQTISGSGGTNAALNSLEISDLDGDNDMDIIASSYNSGMYFYRNTNGLGDFQYEFMSVFDDMYAVYPSDIDGDGDQDIVAVAVQGGGAFDAVVWYENTDGNANFTIQHDVSTAQIAGRSIKAADFDNDGDMDVVTISDNSQVAWYENNDGNGNFSEKQNIAFFPSPHEGRYINIADVDNDNDMDILATYGYNANSDYSKVSVFENLGVLGNEISGKVLIDSDSNGCTNDDIKGSDIMVISDNGSNTFATFTDENGEYQVATTEGSFDTSITSQIPNYFTVNPMSHTFDFTGMNNDFIADFCIEPIGVKNDLNISVYPSFSDPRPGFNTFYSIVYRNMGTTQLSGTIVFEYDNGKLNFLNASETVSSQTSNTIAFGFTDLNPFETASINLEFNVFDSPTTNIDDVLVSNATINPVSGDETEDDNVFSLEQIVIGSYDPNNITVLEGEEIFIEDADTYLHYIIRFQNTGTARAINVRVENVLDEKLDWTTMQLESLSHTGRVEILNGSDVNFIFDNINLPDSTSDEPNSHGFIAYKIIPKDNVVLGDIFDNTADIYFDFNPPIITNTVTTEIVEDLLSVSEFEDDVFKVFPNPTNSKLTIRSKIGINEISIVDINGRLLNTFDVSNQNEDITIDVENLSNGIYFLKIQAVDNEKIVRFIKN